MTALNPSAKETLRSYGVTAAEWRRHHWGPEVTTWHGDTCGCPDDRCINHHHEEHEECRCLPVLLQQYAVQREAGPRCQCAPPDVASPCSGPMDAARLVNPLGYELTGCVPHAAKVLENWRPSGRVYPGSVESAAIDVFNLAHGRTS